MFLRSIRVLPAVALIALAGCGGSSSKGTTTPVQTAAQPATAIVNVNVTSGLVTISPSRTVFTGPSLTVKSSVLTNVAGSPGQKTMAVTLTNGSTQAIGIDPNGNVTGVRVLFGAFTITVGSSGDAVTLSNATGIVPTSTGTNPPYISYPGQIGAAKTSDPLNWNFTVPSGVTAFSVPVTVEADNVFLTDPPSAFGHGSSGAYVRTLVGSGSNGFEDGFAGEARFGQVQGLSVDAAGNVFVADAVNNCIRRISPAGLVSTVAGMPFSTGNVDGTGNHAQFNSPNGVAVTPDGSTIYVTDSNNNSIRRIALTGTDPTNSSSWTVSTICNVAGTVGGNYTVPTRGDTATLNMPEGITLDSAGNIFFDEGGGNRIRKLVFQGGVASDPKSWVTVFLAGDASNIYGASGNKDSSGATARFNEPAGIAIDRSGLIYVTDVFNNRVRVITPAGNVSTVAGTGVAGLVDGTGDVASIFIPLSVACSSSGTVYLGDSSEVRMIEKVNTQ